MCRFDPYIFFPLIFICIPKVIIWDHCTHINMIIIQLHKGLIS